MKKLIIIGHKNPDVDSVISGILLSSKIKNSEYIIPDKYLDLDTYNLLLKYRIDMKKYQKEIPKNSNLFLVDHSETYIQGSVIGIIDHHNTILKKTPKYYINRDISSTALIIYKEFENKFTKEELELIVLANLVDTASFHSSKTKKEDIAVTLKIVEENNLDYKKLYNDGLCLTPLSNLRNAAFNGYMKLKINNKVIASSYVQLQKLDYDDLRIMTDILKKELYIDNIDLYVFIIHDMNNLKTKTIYIENNKITEYNFNKYTSRKETINKYLNLTK